MRKRGTRLVLCLVVMALLTGGPPSRRATGAGPEAGITTRVNVDSAGNQANSESHFLAISANGRFIAFRSEASNLAPGDTNGAHDVFVHDRQTGATTRVSVDSAGNQANSRSEPPSISADGRFVAFSSAASNLVPGDTNGAHDVFVHDRQTGATTRVSVDSAGNQSIGACCDTSISADGRFVAFNTEASNLVPGDTNGVSDIFVHDRQTGATTRVSVDSAGSQANGGSFLPAISADGRFVTFGSFAANLVPGDTNGMFAGFDIFVHDRQTGATTRVNVDSAGNEANSFSFSPSISADGRFVAFGSQATNLAPGATLGYQNVFVHDRQTRVTTLITMKSDGSQLIGDSYFPAISADGRFVAFGSTASNLVPGDTNGVSDTFVHDRQTGAFTRVSVDSAGNQVPSDTANSNRNFDLAISADGRFVAFDSPASNLVSGDTNGVYDIFVHEAVPSCRGLFPTIRGTPGDDVITGTPGRDVIHGLDGNDTINGLGGDDVICGGTGNDTLNGGADRDLLLGGHGNDVLNGQAGNDTLRGEQGDDAMDGGSETDTCDGGPHIVRDTAVNCETVKGVP